ncbi:MAG: putative flippase GtrA [Devosia sp.]|jgi:putative flippase GtrA|tara:strand:+ start:58253 stop:58753 length:501 start_codon:yes stop_codon:yes gene_type:complete
MWPDANQNGSNKPMSAALESLMRDVPRPAQSRHDWLGVFSFVGVGAGGALAFVVLSSVAIWMQTGLADWLVNTLSYAVLILPVYLMHHRYSFGSDAAHRQALPRYLAVQAMALVLAAMFSYGALNIVGLPTVLASIVVVVLTAAVNYVVLRSWAFAQDRAGIALAM